MLPVTPPPPLWAQLPPGRVLPLPGGRATFIRELPGPPGAPCLVLLHGLMVSSDLNWFGAFPALGQHFRVIAMDLPEHGHAARTGRRLRLAECADDVARVAEVLGAEQVVPVGYSMGGLVAQLAWHRHPDVVAGLVLCSTARNFRGSAYEQLASWVMPGVASWMQFNPMTHLMGSAALGMSLLGRLGDAGLEGFARRELDRTSLATTIGSIDEVAAFTSHTWIGGVDVPAAVVVTTRDRVVPVSRQRRLAAAVPGATVHEIEGGHPVCITDPERFSGVLLQACHSVAANLTGTVATAR